MDLLIAIIKNIKASDWIAIVQTVVLTFSLVYLAMSARQQARSTKFIVTPNLGAKWEIESEGSSVTWKLLVSNYSSFPVYIKRVALGFPKVDGFPQGVLGGSFHVPPCGTKSLRTFYMTKECWTKGEGLSGWPVRLFVVTSVGALWEIRFQVIGFDELEFVDIKSRGLLLFQLYRNTCIVFNRFFGDRGFTLFKQKVQKMLRIDK